MTRIYTSLSIFYNLSLLFIQASHTILLFSQVRSFDNRHQSIFGLLDAQRGKNLVENRELKHLIVVVVVNISCPQSFTDWTCQAEILEPF